MCCFRKNSKAKRKAEARNNNKTFRLVKVNWFAPVIQIFYFRRFKRAIEAGKLNKSIRLVLLRGALNVAAEGDVSNKFRNRPTKGATGIFFNSYKFEIDLIFFYTQLFYEAVKIRVKNPD